MFYNGFHLYPFCLLPYFIMGGRWVVFWRGVVLGTENPYFITCLDGWGNKWGNKWGRGWAGFVWGNIRKNPARTLRRPGFKHQRINQT
jgi:hypothetical protein